MRSGWTLAILGIVMMANSGCSGQSTTGKNIDGLAFEVPHENLIGDTILGLPADRSGSFNFVVNPTLPRPEQIVVTLEAASAICNPQTPPASHQLASACAVTRGGGDGPQFQPLEKVYRDGDRTQWEYREKGSGNVIVSCDAAAQEGTAGLCTSLGRYKTLIYSFGLRDVDVLRLPAINKEIGDMLASWERRAAGV